MKTTMILKSGNSSVVSPDLELHKSKQKPKGRNFQTSAFKRQGGREVPTKEPWEVMEVVTRDHDRYQVRMLVMVAMVAIAAMGLSNMGGLGASAGE